MVWAEMVDLKRVMECLGDYKRELEWEGCWETLEKIGQEDRLHLSALYGGLLLESSFARAYAIEALIRLRVPMADIIEQFGGAMDAPCDDWIGFGGKMIEVLSWGAESKRRTDVLRRLASDSRFGLINRLRAWVMSLGGGA